MEREVEGRESKAKRINKRAKKSYLTHVSIYPSDESFSPKKRSVTRKLDLKRRHLTPTDGMDNAEKWFHLAWRGFFSAFVIQELYRTRNRVHMFGTHRRLLTSKASFKKKKCKVREAKP